MKHFAYNKQGGYKGHLETTALLSFPPKHATLEIKARCLDSRQDGLLLEGRSTAGHRGKPFPFELPHFSYRSGLSGTGTENTTITSARKGKKLRNLHSLIFGKQSEPLEGLSRRHIYYWQ